MVNASDDGRYFTQFLTDAEERKDDIAIMMPVFSDGRFSGYDREMMINLYNDIISQGICADSSRTRA